MSMVSASSADSEPSAPRRRNPPGSPTPSLGSGYEFMPEPRPQRRRRSTEESEEEAKRYCLDPPLQQRERAAPRRQGAVRSPTFAEAARRSPPASPSPTSQLGVSRLVPTSPSQSAAPRGDDATATSQPKPKPQKRPRYPPLVVERLPGWAAHFRAISAKLGRPPNARPYGVGVRFSPESEEEFRLVQRYLTGLEKESGVSWFAYSLPAERSLKVAIRGLPVDTTPAEIEEELRALGYEPEYVRHIKARGARPGCVFHAVLKRTPDVRKIFDTSVFLYMRGVKIEAWRSKRGPAQCHRCQKFRHSSHHCHRPLACVRCGEGHAARDCPRPREEPATCANCGGSHPACNIKCPVFQAEIRNRRAGTVAATTASRRPTKVTEGPTDVASNEAQGASLMAAANGPTTRGEAPSSTRRRKRKKRRGKGKKPESLPAAAEGDNPRGDQPTQAQAVSKLLKKMERPTAGAGIAQPSTRTQTTTKSAGPAAGADTAQKKKEFTACAIQLLMDLIKAIRQGQDAELVILDGLAALLTLYHG